MTGFGAPASLAEFRARRDPNAATTPVDPEDEAAVWRVIEDEHVAFWSQGYAADTAFHVQASYEQLWSWGASSGVTIHANWEELSRGLRDHFEKWPLPNPYVIAGTRREKKTIRIMGDVAWVTFEEVYPTDGLPGFSGPSGCIHELRILERHNGVWKIAFMGMLDEQFGQTETPTWQINQAGRILRQNSAATAYLKHETELSVRAGRLGMRDADTDRRFQEVIRRIGATPPQCLVAGSDAAPVVHDPGNDNPVRVWWVVARSDKLFVLFNDPGLIRGRLEIATRAFRLSPAQERLSISIVSGSTLPEAAKREGIRVSTARTHLKRIYDKVGVRAQSALVQTLLTATTSG